MATNIHSRLCGTTIPMEWSSSLSFQEARRFPSRACWPCLVWVRWFWLPRGARRSKAVPSTTHSIKEAVRNSPARSCRAVPFLATLQEPSKNTPPRDATDHSSKLDDWCYGQRDEDLPAASMKHQGAPVSSHLSTQWSQSVGGDPRQREQLLAVRVAAGQSEEERKGKKRMVPFGLRRHKAQGFRRPRRKT